MNPTGSTVNKAGQPGAGKDAGPEHVRPMVKESYATGTNSIKRHTTDGKKPSNPGTPHAHHSDMTN